MAAPRCAKSLRRKALRRLKIYKKKPAPPLDRGEAGHNERESL